MTAVDWIYLTGIVLVSAMVGLVCFRLGMAHEREAHRAEVWRLRQSNPATARGVLDYTEDDSDLYVDNDELSW